MILYLSPVPPKSPVSTFAIKNIPNRFLVVGWFMMTKSPILYLPAESPFFARQNSSGKLRWVSPSRSVQMPYPSPKSNLCAFSCGFPISLPSLELAQSYYSIICFA